MRGAYGVRDEVVVVLLAKNVVSVPLFANAAEVASELKPMFLENTQFFTDVGQCAALKFARRMAHAQFEAQHSVAPLAASGSSSEGMMLHCLLHGL